MSDLVGGRHPLGTFHLRRHSNHRRRKPESEEKKDQNYYQCECRYGSFRRVIELPDTIDANKVTGEPDNGIMAIHVAKKPGVKTKK